MIGELPEPEPTRINGSAIRLSPRTASLSVAAI